MRKILLSVILVAVCSVSLFASVGEIGVTGTTDWFFGSSTSGHSVKIGTFDLILDGANYFGSAGMFGIDWGVGVTFPYRTNLGIVNSTGTDFFPGAMFKIGFGYNFDILSFLDITGGVGYKFRLLLDVRDDYGFMIRGLVDNELYADVAVRIRPIENLGISAGIAVGLPIWAYVQTGEQIDTVTDGLLGISIGPFVGVSYVY